MPATYSIDEARRLVLSSATGILTVTEMLDHQSSLRNNTAFEPGFDQLADFRDVAEVNLSAYDVRQLADGNPFRAGAKRAFVVSRPLHYGLARMFQILTEEHQSEIRIFYDAEEARRWLGLEL